MDSFALYRFPHQKHYVTVRGNATILNNFTEIGSSSCFAVAPFSISDESPLVVITPEDVESKQVPDIEVDEHVCIKGTESEKSAYIHDFNVFHKKLTNGEFTKIVLARTTTAECTKEPEQLFLRACNLYPRLFIALVSTPQSGSWLIATPEVLLEKNANKWHTMALAGTMRIGNIEWSRKNIDEQQFVARYINDRIRRHTDNIQQEGPYAVRAGNLVHLRSDFNFTLENDTKLGNLISSLHPTPAVCGLPKDETYKFIINNESINRRYYSGFMGPINIEGETHLYVTLRCMMLRNSTCTLYAGGGLLKDSDAESEWLETEAKSETIKKIL